MIYEIQGDCCSKSWFSDIIGLSVLYEKTCAENKIVTRTGDLNLGSTELRTKQDLDQVYGVVINFKMQDILILHRNSSNGYYGGWMGLISNVNRFNEVYFKELNDDYYVKEGD